MNEEPDDEIAALIRRAGKRPPVPEDRKARVKAAVIEHWRQAIGVRAGAPAANVRPSPHRWIWIAGGLAAAMLVVVAGAGLLRRMQALEAPAGTASTAPGAAAAHVARTRGQVSLALAGTGAAASHAALNPGDAVGAGGEIRTGPLALTALRLPAGQSLRLDGETRLRVVSEEVFELVSGAVYVDSGPPGPSGGSIEVRTSRGVMRDIGTQFEARVTAGGGLRLRVREGSVSLTATAAAASAAAASRAEPGDGGPTRVEAGTEAELDAGGGFRRRDLLPYGSDWSWIEEAAPMMDIQGRSAREYLDWVARERGVRLEFDPPALADEASLALLNGSVAALSIEQSLEAVLPTCGLAHRSGKDTLLVRRAQP